MKTLVPHSNEAQLIKELKRGSKQAFDEIYELYVNRLYAYCFQYVKSKERTEEIVQDVFVKLWNTRETIKQETSVAPLLFVISKRLVINAYRSTVNSPTYEDYLECSEQTTGNSTSAEIEYDEFLRQVNNVLRTLPSTQQDVVRLSKLEQMTNREIAMRLLLSEQTVKNQLSLGLKALRCRLLMVLSKSLIIYFIFF